MSTIDRPEQAAKLARAIVTDIKLYNEEAIREGADISEAVAGGRALFHGRVVPALHGVFEEEVAQLRSAPRARPAEPAPVATAPEVATRLARAIVADIKLYNSDAEPGGPQMQAAVAEGRGLFRARVSPNAYEVFERELGALQSMPYSAPVERPVERPFERPLEEPYVRRRPAQRSSTGLFVGVVILVLVAIALGAFFAARGH